MDQALQNPEILSLGAKVLGLAAASHSKFRSEIATGDGVSLFVEAMKSHSKDVPTLTALFIAMVNISYNNKDNKSTFIAHDGLDVFQPAFVICNAIKDQLEDRKASGTTSSSSTAVNGTHDGEESSPRRESSPRAIDDVLYSEKQLDHFAGAALSLLRNVAPLVPRETSAEPLIRSLLHFCRTFLNGKPELVSSALVCVASLISTSVSAKVQFVSKWSGLEDLSKLWTQYASYARVMQPLTVILQLLSKINAHRVVIAQEFLARLHEQVSSTHTRDPGVLHPTMSVFYQLSFNTKTRAQVANLPDLMKTLLASLQVNMPSPRLHAVTSKVLIRLCAIDQCKRQIQAEGGITAILTPMNAYSGDTRVTKFLAQLVNIVLTNTSSSSVSSSGNNNNNNGSSSSSNSSGHGASAASRRTKLGTSSGGSNNESDSYSDSDSDSYSDSDSDSDSDSSSSSGSSSDSEDADGKRSTSAPPPEKPLPILSATDLDAAIAELEASTAQFSSANTSNASNNTTSTSSSTASPRSSSTSSTKSGTPSSPKSSSTSTSISTKKPSPKRSASGSPSKQDLPTSPTGRPGTPIDSSIDDLNALARQITDGTAAVTTTTATTATTATTTTNKANANHNQGDSSAATTHHASHSEIKAQLESVKSQLTTTESLVEQLKKENEELKLSAADADLMPKLKLELSIAMQQQETLKVTATQLESEAEKAREGEIRALAELETLREEIRSDNAVMESQLVALSASLKSLQAQKQAAEGEVGKKASELEDANLQLSKQLENVKTELNQVLSTNNQKTEEFERNQRTLEDERKAMKEELLQLRTEAESSAKSRLENETLWKQEIQEMKEALEQRDRAGAAMEDELASLRRERESLSQANSSSSSSSTTTSQAIENPIISNRPLPVENTKPGMSPDTSAPTTAANQVFSQPAPSFSAQSVSSPSSATGGRTDVSTSPLSASHTYGQDELYADSSSSLNGVSALNLPSSPSSSSVTTKTMTTIPSANDIDSSSSEALLMKEKGWIRLIDHQSAVANLESQLSKLKFELEDALEHSLHFQVLSIRLDYLGRGDPVPSIEAIRKLLLTGNSDQIPKITAPRDRAAQHAAIVAHSYPSRASSDKAPSSPSSSSSSSTTTAASSSSLNGTTTSSRR